MAHYTDQRANSSESIGEACGTVEVPARYAREIEAREHVLECCPIDVYVSGVGGPGGSAACDTCNRPLSDGQRRSDALDAEADTVIAYATLAPHASTGALRWVSCEECGAPGDGSVNDPDEAVAKATLGFDRRIGAFALQDVREIEIA